ncbi:MAG: cytochrome ubiquinol oxidase subunit I [Gammaproteobacteria bacterium]|nr:cytochrome ubiquinol oxidase subunit I [Gammaproteobacteria bacterium]
MEWITPVLLSRIQFAANISFHILFPTITLALAWVLLAFKVAHIRTGDSAWQKAYQIWVKVFALSFALGVVSGVTMSFQFGTNWPGFMETVGDVAGPLLAYEVLSAFFLEATFLGIMLFGQQRVPRWLHTLSILLVAIGTSLSAFWILVLDSWMQTPAGFEMLDGKAVVTDWYAVIFNPSMPYRLMHMLTASALTVAFLIAGLSAYMWLKGRRDGAVLKPLRAMLVFAALVAPLQLLLGDLHGLNTLEHQPQKVAAMEGIWEDSTGVPLLLFAVPDSTLRENHYEIGIPFGASLILTHEWKGEIKGLNSFEDHPPVPLVFYSFRVMVGIGSLMIFVAPFVLWRWRKQGDLSKPIAYGLVAMTFSGWVATLAGWYVTEVGRQPWLVNGVLRVADAVGPVGSAPILMTLTMYLVTYVLLLAAFIWTLFYMARQTVSHDTAPTAQWRPAHG